MLIEGWEPGIPKGKHCKKPKIKGAATSTATNTQQPTNDDRRDGDHSALLKGQFRESRKYDRTYTGTIRGQQVKFEATTSRARRRGWDTREKQVVTTRVRRHGDNFLLCGESLGGGNFFSGLGSPFYTKSRSFVFIGGFLRVCAHVRVAEVTNTINI
jgi:hypothetical protein